MCNTFSSITQSCKNVNTAPFSIPMGLFLYHITDFLYSIRYIALFTLTFFTLLINCCIQLLSSLLLQTGIGSSSPYRRAKPNLLCSLKQIQRVRQSLFSVIEMLTLERYHFAHYKRDYRYLFKHCTHTPPCSLFMDSCCARDMFYTLRNNLHLCSSFTFTHTRGWRDNAPGFSREVSMLFCVTGQKDLLYFPTESPSAHRWIINGRQYGNLSIWGELKVKLFWTGIWQTGQIIVKNWFSDTHKWFWRGIQAISYWTCFRLILRNVTQNTNIAANTGILWSNSL